LETPAQPQSCHPAATLLQKEQFMNESKQNNPGQNQNQGGQSQQQRGQANPSQQDRQPHRGTPEEEHMDSRRPLADEEAEDDDDGDLGSRQSGSNKGVGSKPSGQGERDR
jgi:hypothetical protein